jgi:hypothetical protein
LNTMANNPAVSDDDLQVARAALSKTVNSLSREPRIVGPAAVDSARTIFVVDLRVLGWDRGLVWLKLEQAYPYGLKYDALPDEILPRIDGELCELTGCDLPIVRADWFVAAVTRLTFCRALLHLPADAAATGRELGVETPFGVRHARPEPITELTRLYRLNGLDLNAVASELEFEDPQSLVRQVGETQLKRLGLDGLLRGGVITRQEWEAVNGLSLMQELARELRYTPLMVR